MKVMPNDGETVDLIAAFCSDETVRRKILVDTDPRLARMSDPTTWPAQAKLAAAGDMAGLQALQDSLKGGRQAS